MVTRYNILACPFCGRDPQTFGSGEGRRGLMIECVTEDCVNPHVSYYDRKTAVRAWNRRREMLPSFAVTDADINATSPL